jgi:hypothetical protein
VGRPYISGFEVQVSGNGRGAARRQFTTAYFYPLAEAFSAVFVEKGVLKVGELYRFGISAFPVEAPEEHGGLQVAAMERPLPLHPMSIGALLPRAVGFMAPDAVEMPLFIAWQVLQEAAALTRAAGALETGGILIGHLHRDESSPEIFAEITAQIALQHAQSALTKLTFTPDTWAAADDAIQLRGRGEVYLGWWHSHSYSKETHKLSGGKTGHMNDATFLSAEDLHLHRAVFSRAYNVALLATDSPSSGLTWSCFGWRQGTIAARGFQILGLRENGATALSEEKAHVCRA